MAMGTALCLFFNWQVSEQASGGYVIFVVIVNCVVSGIRGCAGFVDVECLGGG